MKIYRAVKTNWISQRFGANAVKWYKKWGMKGHNGIDWIAQDGEKIYFDVSCKGVVLNTHIDGKGGLGVDIITEDKDGIFKHRYWHLKEFKCKAGDIMETGDLIGLADNTGWSTGTHLHRGLKPQTKDENGEYKNSQQDNGYKGGIDYAPYLKSVYVKDYMDYLTKQLSMLQRMIELFKKLLKV